MLIYHVLSRDRDLKNDDGSSKTLHRTEMDDASGNFSTYMGDTSSGSRAHATHTLFHLILPSRRYSFHFNRSKFGISFIAPLW